MVRFAILSLLVLVSVARAQDDDGATAPPVLGDPIPERIEALEREWADDVGLKEPGDEPHDDAEANPAESPDPKDGEDETEPVRARAVDDAPRPRAPSALKNPLGDERGKSGAKPEASDAPPASAPSAPPAERGAKSEGD